MDIDKLLTENSPVINIRFTNPSESFNNYDIQKIMHFIEQECLDHEIRELQAYLGIKKRLELRHFLRLLSGRRRYPYGAPTLMLKSAHNGSLIFETVCAAGATWILLNTLGETFKDAYKKTNLHKKLTDFLLTGFGKSNSRPGNKSLSYRIERRLKSSPVRRFIDHSEVAVIEEKNKTVIKIEIRLYSEEDKLIRTKDLSSSDTKELKNFLDELEDILKDE